MALPTLGLSSFWFLAAQHRFYWSHTTFAGARFQSTLTGGGLLGLAVTSILMVVFTLGIALPWVQVRRVRYLLSHLTLHGPIAFAAIRQQAVEAGATGEGLADLVGMDDLGAGLGM